MAIRQQHLRFYLDSTQLADDPQDWDEATITLERDTQLNGIFTTYNEKLTYIGDGYDYLINLIDTQNFCGEVRLEIYEYVGDNRLTDGFSFIGIINLSDCEINRTKRTIKVSALEDTLVTLFKKYSTLEVPLNNTQNKTMNGEAISPVGGQLNRLPNSISIYPSGVLGTDKIGYVLYSDAFQYLLSYISDNRILLDSDLLQVNRFDEYINYLTFSALTGGQTSIVSFDSFGGERITFTTSGAKTAAQHAAAFADFVVYHFDNSNDRFCNNLDSFPGVGLLSDQVGIVLIHNPNFDFGLYVTESPLRGTFTDGAANVAFTTPFYIITQNVTNATIPISFQDFYQEFSNIYDCELRFIKDGSQYKLQIEKRSDFINNSTSTIILYESNIYEMEDKYADDLIFETVSWNQRSEGETVCLLNKASYQTNGCGITEKKINLKYYYGAKYHIDAVADAKTGGEIMPIRYDDLITLYGAPTPYWWATYLDGYDDTANAFDAFTRYKWLVGDFANHAMVMKRRLETVNAIATQNEFQIISDNPYRILRKISFTYPIQWQDFRTMNNDPSSPISIVMNDNTVKKAWIKKIQYNVLTGLTKFELYTS